MLSINLSKSPFLIKSPYLLPITRMAKNDTIISHRIHFASILTCFFFIKYIN